MPEDEIIEDEPVEEAPEVTFARCDGSGEAAGEQRQTNLTEGQEYGRCAVCDLMAPVTKAGKLKVHEAPQSA